MKKRMFSALVCLCILSVITGIAAGASAVLPDTEESREGMILVLKKETGYKDGEKSYSVKYEYDEQGRLIRTISSAPGDYGKLYGDWEYDENGNVIRAHQEFANDDDIYWESEYGADGKILQTTTFNKYDGSASRTKYEYDAEGNLLTETENAIGEAHSEGRLLSGRCYEYDAQGNMIRMIHDEKAGSCAVCGRGTYRYIYKYDAQGNMVKEICVHDEGGWQSEYGYDMRGNRVWNIVYDSDKNIVTQSRYEYDEQNHLLREYLYDSDGELHRQYQYEYDAQGNEISKTYYVVFGDTYIVDYSYTVERKYAWIEVE